MKILSGLKGSIEELSDIVSCLSSDDECQCIMLLACDGNEYSPENVDPILKNCPVPIFGGIFPEIILDNRNLTRGVIAAGCSKRSQPTVITGLSSEDSDYEAQILEKIPYNKDIKTMFIFADGMAGRISALIEGVFNTLGIGINYIGGGAGSLSFVQKPCIFTNSGLLADVAVLVSTEINSGIGVKHGWNTVKSGLSVTGSHKNIIRTINWQPAFQVYSDIVEEHSGMKFRENNFFDIAKSYPFGIRKLGTENIVRDPLMKEDNDSLVCVGEVPQNSYVEILSGDKESLIDAAENARKEAEESFYSFNEKIETIFFIDCISRVLFLEEAFQDELNKVYIEGMPMIGALTLGEIANSGKDYLEFYNKTAVVGMLNK